MELTRRTLIGLAGTAAAAAGTAALVAPRAGHADEAAAETTEFTYTAGHQREGLPSFLQQPEPITDIAQTYDYEVVVVGAGSPGVPCALAAFEDGVDVAVITKGFTASAYGNTGSGVDLETSDPADVARLVSNLMIDSQHRPDRALYDMWAKYSGEAVKWLVAKGQEAGAQVIDQGNAQHQANINRFGYNVNFVTSFFGPKPYTTGEGMQDLLAKAEADGLPVYYETPGVQLVQDENGRVTGVIAETENGYVRFNASKAVVLATGDYQNDTQMLYYYQPDMMNLGPKQHGRTGDGHKMAVWAGGSIENLPHTKMLHDFDAGPASMCDMPFLRVKMNGERFCNELAEMSIMNCYLRSAEDQGNYCQVFDADYMEKAAEFPGGLVDPEGLKNYMPEEDGEKTGVLEGFIGTFKADTLEELAAKLEITDVDAFVATVERWNQLCADGADPEFGLKPEYLKAIDTPPFYGIHRHVRMSQICSGVNINADLQVVDAEDQPIEGLYAIGNVAGGFYGGIDYPLTVPGLNLGHNYTQGYVLGKRLAGTLAE